MSASLPKNLQSETVRRLPLREAITVGPKTHIRDVVARMRQKQLGCAIVVDEQGRPLGVFTERSVIDLLLEDPKLELAVVGDHLDQRWTAVRESDPIARVLEAVIDQGLRFVCVVNDEGKVTALTGQRGLSEYIAEYYPQQVMVQRVGGKPSTKHREGA